MYYTAENYGARHSIGYLIRRASKLVISQVEALFAEQDISFTQYVVLVLLRDNLASTASDICQQLGYDTGALTRVIEQLRRRGLIERKRNIKDKRIISLSLSPLGRETIENFCPLVFNHYNQRLEDFSFKEIDTLLTLLTKFIASLEKNTEFKG